LYFATDSTPGDAALHELCTEYTDLHWEMDQIYGLVNIYNMLEKTLTNDDTSDDEDLEGSTHLTNGKKRRENALKIRPAASGYISLSNGFAIAHWELSKCVS
jgi:hypothetical protein